jgi:hypothetical protein
MSHEHIDITQIKDAASVLKRSERGNRVMRDALQFLDNSDAIGLDQFGREALLTLMRAAMTSHPCAARDAMRGRD